MLWSVSRRLDERHGLGDDRRFAIKIIGIPSLILDKSDLE